MEICLLLTKYLSELQLLMHLDTEFFYNSSQFLVFPF